MVHVPRGERLRHDAVNMSIRAHVREDPLVLLGVEADQSRPTRRYAHPDRGLHVILMRATPRAQAAAVDDVPAQIPELSLDHEGEGLSGIETRRGCQHGDAPIEILEADVPIGWNRTQSATWPVTRRVAPSVVEVRASVRMLRAPSG